MRRLCWGLLGEQQGVAAGIVRAASDSLDAADPGEAQQAEAGCVGCPCRQALRRLCRESAVRVGAAACCSGPAMTQAPVSISAWGMQDSLLVERSF